MSAVICVLVILQSQFRVPNVRLTLRGAVHLNKDNYLMLTA